MMRRFLAAFVVFAWVLTGHNTAWAQKEIHLALGDPGAGQAAGADNHFMDKQIFALSYNSSKGTSNWVGWRLVKSDFHDADREDDFHADPDLMPPMTIVRYEDYAGTGFDSGHMCPDADRNISLETESKTYAMTNMVPQTGKLNRGIWSRIEARCREAAKKDKEVYIVAGPLGKGGIPKAKKPPVESFAMGKVTVPSHCWKVILVVDAGPGTPAQRVRSDSPVIAFILANDDASKSLDDKKATGVVSVAEVEKRTGLTFFAAVPADVRSALVNRVSLPSVLNVHAAPQPLMVNQPQDVMPDEIAFPRRIMVFPRPGILFRRR